MIHGEDSTKRRGALPRTALDASGDAGSVLPSNLGLRRGVVALKAVGLILLLCLSGCSWLHRRQPPPPTPPELVVTGVPPGSTLFVDGVPLGQPSDGSSRSRILEVSPGMHTLEVKMGDTVAYRENAYVGMGDRRVITVLSGNSPRP